MCKKKSMLVLVAFLFSTHSKKKKERKIMTFRTLLANTTK